MSIAKPSLTWSPEAIEALRIMNDTRENLFLTGRAGTGKSTLLTEFRRHTKKRIAVLAPTGVAAVNVGGQTIHSFSGFKPNITLKKVKKLPDDNKKVKVLEKLDAIVIDEISMTRADLLDCFERFLRLNRKNKSGGDLPFGGLQMIFIGDLYQLPPVVTSSEKSAFETLYDSPYFFSAKSFVPGNFRFIELEKVYRQSDSGFIRLLNAIRNNSVDEEDFAGLNARYMPDNVGAGRNAGMRAKKGTGLEIGGKGKADNFTVCLTSTNAKATEINTANLEQLPGNEHVFTASITGSFDRSHMPTDEVLRLKVGAQVMLLNNDPGGKWVNGTMAVIEDIDEYNGITVRLETGKSHVVSTNEWDVFEYYVDGGGLKTKTTGSFTQYPLKLAWALTIHKSQGKTFDEVIIDIGRGTFAHGQLYVALSRCRTLQGITLRQPLQKRHVIMDWRVVRFVTSIQYAKSEEKCSLDDRVAMIARAIADKSALAVTYLKNNDEKSRRVIEPLRVGEMEYKGKNYLGVEAFCRLRQDVRVFRVDRMLEIKRCGDAGY
ncbi:MAG: AAA family ATPase [Patescibacteria group bacterium]|nr:AAA family ATPase [Patescibacteria group bacterium]